MELSQINKLLSEQITNNNYIKFKELVAYLNRKYYIDSLPIITDKEFDDLFVKIKRYELDNSTTINSKEAIYNNVAYGIANEFRTINHRYPMLSLSNSYNLEDLIEWSKSIQKEIINDEVEYSVEPKLDGSSISIIYRDDKIYQSATRGNGSQGEDITLNSKFISNLQHKVKFSKYGIKEIELRGEVVIERGKFNAFNLKRLDEGLDTFQNPRNTASGSLRLKDPSEVKNRNLEVFIYSVGHIEMIDDSNINPFHQTHFGNLKLIEELGIKTTYPQSNICKSIKEVFDRIEEFEKLRQSYQYDTDGMVIKVNSIPHQDTIGETSHHPRWAIAYKFKAEEAKSKLLEISYQVGRTGVVTPVANIEPIEISGVTIKRVSLHNQDFIVSKDIRQGDIVYVERSGEVIPYITRVDIKSRHESSKPFEFISNCPSCNTFLIRIQDQSAIKCPNLNCPDKNIERIIYFVSKEAMDIKGLGRDIVKRFMLNGMISDIESIYTLDYDLILSMEGWQTKSVNRLRDSIKDSKFNPLYKLINGLGIEGVGMQMSKTLSKKVNHLLEYTDWTIENYLKLDDIGDKIAKVLFEYFNDNANIQTLKNLESLGINLNGDKISDTGVFYQKTIVFSGFRDNELQLQIESMSGEVVNSLSKKTDILILKQKGSGSSKEKKAEEYGTSIYSIEDFKEEFGLLID